MDTNEQDCPVCDGSGEPMGALGKHMWYRCRNCGIDFSIPVSSLEYKEDMETDFPHAEH